MIGLADRIETCTALKTDTHYAPFDSVEKAEDRVERRRWLGAGIIATLLVLSAITAGVSRGQTAIVESYGISQESVLGIAWVLQGIVALVCFVLIVRWLRS
ncbi:MAG TPA: hypothetical protein VLM38_13120 [Blastocatellia bacterium]|nr:hypothetical protein [Blastocatellia bacterium]